MLHRIATLDLHRLTSIKGHSAFYAYAHSKLCLVFFTRELAQRWAPRGVTTNCLHPGEIATRFGAEAGGLVTLFFDVFHLFGRDSAVAAARLARLAASHDLSRSTGYYFNKDEPVPPNPEVEDQGKARLLWETTAARTGINLAEPRENAAA
jgi:NAD(P)-dependent dehydrogenase (short-subunit alcohol dehydrogenase family)